MVRTRREREVIALVSEGLMNKQIAWELGIAEVTVKVHRASASRKMGVRSVAALKQWVLNSSQRHAMAAQAA